MRFLHAFILCLLLAGASAQSVSTEPLRTFSFTLTTGTSQDFASKTNTVNDVRPRARPVFTENFNHLSLGFELVSIRNPHLVYMLNTGYQSLRPSYGVFEYNSWNGQFLRGENIPAFFLSMGAKWEVTLNERWALLPGMGLDLHYLFKAQNVNSFISHTRVNPFFLTLSPSMEFRMWLSHNVSGSFVVNYRHGLMPAIKASLTAQGSEELAQYNGNSLMLGLRLIYCIPCRE
ncbi:MAG: hypothetical protein ACPF9D_02485 [Owenweeksia sp.]